MAVAKLGRPAGLQTIKQNQKKARVQGRRVRSAKAMTKAKEQGAVNRSKAKSDHGSPSVLRDSKAARGCEGCEDAQEARPSLNPDQHTLPALPKSCLSQASSLRFAPFYMIANQSVLIFPSACIQVTIHTHQYTYNSRGRAGRRGDNAGGRTAGGAQSSNSLLSLAQHPCSLSTESPEGLQRGNGGAKEVERHQVGGMNGGAWLGGAISREAGQERCCRPLRRSCALLRTTIWT
jgi:hypothetical protein